MMSLKQKEGIDHMSMTDLETQDKDIFDAIAHEHERQHEHIELIASENFVSPAVLEAQGSILTNKYAEGYPGRRYYGGCQFADQVETLAIERAKTLYGCVHANVQPHSGSQANQAVFLALLSPGDRILGMDLNSGGHLTHGSPVNLSGKWFDSHGYGLDSKTHLIDYDQVRDKAKTLRPKMIIAGGSAYTPAIDFKIFHEIAREVDAYLLVDMAHYAGLIAAGVYPSPFPYADVVTTTTHKTLRGPRGGMVLIPQRMDLAKKIDSALFPGLQGGPLMHIIAAKAVAFKEAMTPAFQAYAREVVDNARTLGHVLQENGLPIISGRTDCHMVLADLRAYGVTGHDACNTLESFGLTCNKNGIPNDPLPPMKTSGIRLGSAACTTRGMGSQAFVEIGKMIIDVLEKMQEGASPESYGPDIKKRVHDLTKRFPLPTPPL